MNPEIQNPTPEPVQPQPLQQPQVPQQPPTQPSVPVSQPVVAPVQEQVPQPLQAPQAALQPQMVVVAPEQASDVSVDSVDSLEGPATLPEQEPVQWQAVEYLQHTKTPIWYVGFVVVVALLMVAALLLMKSWTFAILIPVMAVALIVYSHRPLRQLNYVLSSKGLHINEQLHPLGEFKSFGVMQDESLNSLILIPVKRFRPSLTVYFPTEVGERIVDTLGAYIPMQPVRLDAFDKIVRKLRI